IFLPAAASAARRNRRAAAPVGRRTGGMSTMKKWALATGITVAIQAMIVSAADHAPAAGKMLESQWSMLDEYCSECHNYNDYGGGLALEDFAPGDVAQNPAVFEEVLRKLKISAMPPRTQPQPSGEQRARFVASLEQTLDAAAVADP